MSKIDLSERPKSRSELARWYAVALEDQADSGLSVSEFAEALGVTPATLYQWKRRLGRSDHNVPRTTSSPVGLVQVSMVGN